MLRLATLAGVTMRKSSLFDANARLEAEEVRRGAWARVTVDRCRQIGAPNLLEAQGILLYILQRQVNKQATAAKRGEEAQEALAAGEFVAAIAAFQAGLEVSGFTVLTQRLSEGLKDAQARQQAQDAAREAASAKLLQATAVSLQPPVPLL